jgi:hypothetical protein
MDITPPTVHRRHLGRRATWALALLLVLASQALDTALTPAALGSALAPPVDRLSHGAAGTARNGHGGAIAPSPTSASWPGTAPGRNGGPFAFVGAQYGALWKIPAGVNNSRGVGYCVMEDVTGEGTVTLRADPASWKAGEMAAAAALMATFGGDRVVPYGIDDTGAYDVATGEWTHPLLFGGGEYTRRRQVAVNFGVRMFLSDVSPSGVAAGRKLARDTAVVNGSGGEFAALRSGYVMAQRLAAMAERQRAIGGVSLELVWRTPDGAPPQGPGTFPLEVRAIDTTGKRVGHVPVLQLSNAGIGTNRSAHASARVDNRADTPADLARWKAAAATGWPVWGMNHRIAGDPRFALTSDPRSADVADAQGVARFDVTVTSAQWELAFHVQAPTSNVDLYAGTGIQGNVTWSGAPQSASVHQQATPHRYLAVAKSASDPSVPVTGTEFALEYAGGEIGRATVGVDGLAVFDGFSPDEFQPPFALREVRTAPGLEPIVGDIAVPPTAELSVDPLTPTLVEVRNTAIVGRFRVRKTLDDTDIQGTRDMSGFSFHIQQMATGAVLGTSTTGADGRTPPIDAVLGSYRVVETARPAWAEGLTDGGPVTFWFDPTAPPGAEPSPDGPNAGGGDPDGVGEIVYTNNVPDVSITTSASDLADGDQFVDLSRGQAAIIDSVRACGLVAGTEYRLNGELQVIHDAAGSAPVPLVEPSGVTGVTAFVAEATCDDVEVRFELAQDSPLAGHVVVVYEWLSVAGTARVVASHVDPNDQRQKIYLPFIRTNLHREGTDGTGLHDSTVEPGSRLVDAITFAGLAPDRRYRAELTLHERRDGRCAATDVVVVHDFDTASSSGLVTMSGIVVPGPGMYVAFQRVSDLGTAIGTPASTGGGPPALVAVHDDCDDVDQTVWAATRSVTPPTSAPVATTTTAPANTATVPTTPKAPVADPARPQTGQLPRTGGGGTERLLLVAGVLALTGGIMLAVTRPLRRRAPHR